MDNLTGHLNQLHETLNKRNAGLKEVRQTLQKTEEERDENWRLLQLEIRDKRSLTAKVKELSEALEHSDQRLCQSESARKALVKTLHKLKLEQPRKTPEISDQNLPVCLEGAYKLAVQEIERVTEKFEDERRRRLELKTLAKKEISDLQGEAEAARGFAEKCEQLASLRETERDEAQQEVALLKRQVFELDEFKRQALKQWMANAEKQIAG